MISVATKNDDCSTEIQMEGAMPDVLTEAVLIVNALYNAITKADSNAGAIFQIEVRFDESVWKTEPQVSRYEGTVVSIPERGPQ